MSDLIEAYLAHLRAGGRSVSTIRDRRYLLKRLDAELPYGLDEFGTEDLEDWLAPYSGWSLCTYYTSIRDFCRWAAGRYHEWDPSIDLAKPRPPDHEPRPASDAELVQALNQLTGPSRLAVILAAFNSLRCAEICRLCREDVDQHHLHTLRKGAKTQLLPIHEYVWQHLAGLPPGPVITTPRGRPCRPAYLSGVVSAELTRIGLPQVTLHRFRATYATRLAEAGVHATVIQDLMGHRSLTTTQRYMKVKDGQRRHAMTALPVPTRPLAEAA